MKVIEKLENNQRKIFQKYFAGNKRNFYLAYSAAFLVLSAFIVLVFIAAGKTFIWRNDGLKQHYTALSYYGTYLRSVIKNILVNHSFSLPMWDLHIGYGSDILTTLHYYTIGDPLNLLSLFVPERFTEYLFGFLIFARMYLSGIAFSRFCFFHKNGEVSVFLGMLIYAFSQWTLVAGFNHPYFINPCIYLPLILLGVDKIFAGKKPFVYILSVALAGVSNFYFFYMLGIFAVIYAVFRYFMLFGWKIKQVCFWLGRFFLYSLCGILLSGFILMPVVTAVLGTDRLNVEHYIPGLYRKGFYHSLLSSFTGAHLSKYTIIGVAAICILSLGVLFLQRKKYAALKTAVVLLTVMLCVPYAGSVMNGFSYATNRWSWAMVMLISYIFVKMYPEFFTLSPRQRWALCGIVLIYGGYMLFDPEVQEMHNGAAGILVLVTAVIFIAGYKIFSKNRSLWAVVAVVSVSASIITNIWFVFGMKIDDKRKVYEYLDSGTAYERTHGSAEQALKGLPGIDSYRFAQNNADIYYNSGMLNGLNGSQFYFSTPPYGMSDFCETNYLDNSLEQKFSGLNNRAWLMKLSSMRYFAGMEGNIPYGYGLVEGVTGLPEGVSVYEDKNPLPFAYTYDSYIPEEDFLKLNAAQRQEAMLQGAVMEKSSLPETKTDFTSEKVPFTVSEEDGVKWKDGEIRVRRDGGSCVLNLNGRMLNETYLAFTDFRFGNTTAAEKGFDKSGAGSCMITIQVPGDNSSNVQTLNLRTKKNNFQSGRRNFLVNLGYRKEPVQRIKLTFEKRGRFVYDKAEILCQDMKNLNGWTEERLSDAPSDLAVSGNHITCSLTLDKEKVLVFSIPYSKGWTLYVDGKKQAIKKANTMFMAAELTSGSHRAELVYATPYIYVGIVLSAAGSLLTFAVWLFYRRKK
ncbi:MAG: YfhO family protein [Eubacteriales bacterium]|nr:YfhO family protein [Eubacteriales bacterium]